MKVVRGALGNLGTFALAALATCPLRASTWTVSFDPSNAVNTAGWDLRESEEQNKTSQSPAGRKLKPDKGKSAFIESPVLSSRIRDVSVSFKCVNAKTGNASKVEVFGRASAADDYRSLLSATGLPGSPTNVCASACDAATRDEFDCRQVKIVYTKDNSSLNGNLVISSVTFTLDGEADGGGSDGNGGAAGETGETDDGTDGEETTPTNLRTEVVDAATRQVRVRWDLPAGVTESRWRTFTTVASGGLDGAAALWRETFDGVPAAKTKKIETDGLAAFSLADGWEAENVRQTTTAGALLIGWEKSATGSLTTPPLGQDFAAGHVLVLNAASRDVTSGVLPVSVVAGAVTSCVAEVTITKTPCDYLIVLPALAATDRILVQSLTNCVQRATLVHDLAICAEGAYQPAAVVTNACSEVMSVAEPAAILTVPADGTNLWIETCATCDGEDSAWTEPFLVTLASSDDDDGDGATDTDATDGEGEAAADRFVVLEGGDSSFVFSVEGLAVSDGKRDVSETPFRFLLDGAVQKALGSRDATRQLNVGVYVCTNVFESDWAVLVPGSPGKGVDFRDAECRLTIRTADFAVRRIELSADFAQLNATNKEEKALSLQYRAVASDGTAGAWTTLGEYRSTYTAADVAPDLAGTRTNVACAADVRLPRGAAVEARVYCRKANDSGREAPLGFRDFRVRVRGLGPPLLYLFR